VAGGPSRYLQRRGRHFISLKAGRARWTDVAKGREKWSALLTNARGPCTADVFDYRKGPRIYMYISEKWRARTNFIAGYARVDRCAEKGLPNQFQRVGREKGNSDDNRTAIFEKATWPVTDTVNIKNNTAGDGKKRRDVIRTGGL